MTRWRAVCGVERTRWRNSRAEAEQAAIDRGWASRDDHGDGPPLMGKPPLFKHPMLRLEREKP